MQDLINIDESTGMAKYKQIVQGILNGISDGQLDVGDKIPSINILTKKFGLSQDTVLTAYNELKHRGIISSSVGKGYFIERTDIQERHNIFVLFDKMTSYKEDLYESMKTAVGSKASLDIYFHHSNQKAFNTLITNAIGNYTAYVIVPIISNTTEEVLGKMPKKKVYIIDQGIQRFGKKYRSVCQNFEKDIIDMLSNNLDNIRKYEKISFVHHDQRQQFTELEKGFVSFCKQHHQKYELLNDLSDAKVKVNQLFIIVDDKDLVQIVKSCKKQKFIVGKDIGIISYNDSPFKEVILDGISTISTDFCQMGATVIDLIFNNKTLHLENPTKLIHRNSF